MAQSNRRRWPLSKISTLHFAKLIVRSAFFVVALVLYIINRVRGTGLLFSGLESVTPLLISVWLLFTVEMVLRFFPSPLESMGCEKQFARNFVPAEPSDGLPPQTQGDFKAAVSVALAWIALNAIVGALYLAGIIDHGILILISLAYSVCDMICILFFCPFQTWFIKNKCCGSCRIYNWDYAMMFTPLVFIRNIYTWSLLALAIGLLVKWEIICLRHPERFSEATNASLSCANCQEKLCRHKKTLQKFLLEQRERLWPR